MALAPHWPLDALQRLLVCPSLPFSYTTCSELERCPPGPFCRLWGQAGASPWGPAWSQFIITSHRTRSGHGGAPTGPPLGLGALISSSCIPPRPPPPQQVQPPRPLPALRVCDDLLGGACRGSAGGGRGAGEAGHRVPGAFLSGLESSLSCFPLCFQNRMWEKQAFKDKRTPQPK